MSDLGSGSSYDDRRRHPRAPDQGRAKLLSGRLADARPPAVDVEIVDRSMTGLRIRLERDAAMNGDVILLSAATGQAYEARVVWKAYPHAGLKVRRSVDMRSASGADATALRKLWRETFGA